MGDYLAAERVAEAIAQRAQQRGLSSFVLPALPFGGADYFGSVAGAIALSQASLRAVLTDMFESLLRHGLSRLIVVNGHSGNSQAIHEVTLAMRRAHGVVIPSLYLWKLAAGLLGASGAAPARLGHGADPMASVAMHLFGLPAPRPAVAGAGRVLGLEVADFGCVNFDGVRIDMPVEFDEIAPGGVAPAADGSTATAADGMMLVEQLTEIGARLVAHVIAQTS
jgi:creatinine amidohydrolase